MSSVQHADEDQSEVTTPRTSVSDSPTKYVRPKSYICPYEGCGKAYDRPVRLNTHLRSHTDERPFVCSREGCDKSFRRESHLDYHIKNVHLNQKDYVCQWEGCEKAFVTATKLRKHHESHQGSMKHRCTGYPPCNEQFRKHSTLQKHITLVHLQQKPFPCTYVDDQTGEKCTHAYDTIGRLQAHQGRVHGGMRYWCTLCNADETASQSGSQAPVGFSTYGEFQAHIKNAHPPVCEQCNAVLPTQRALRKHVELNHSDLELKDRKVFICDVTDCGKSFTRQNNLQAHVRAAHEKRRFVCGQFEFSKLRNVNNWDGANACGRDFASKAGLEDHIRTQHQGLAAKPRRKELRNQPSTNQNFKPVSGISQLTGADYGEKSGREIKCIVSTCPYRFYRDYDLEIHLESMHRMSPDQVAEAVTEYNALNGGQFWIGGIGNDGELVTQGVRSIDAQSTSGGETPILGAIDDGEMDTVLDPRLAVFDEGQDIFHSNY